jgi:hypothetical protein
MLITLLFLLAAAAAGAVGGAAAGVKLGGETMGNQTAGLMGAFFALSAVVPGAMVALAIHHLM